MSDDKKPDSMKMLCTEPGCKAEVEYGNPLPNGMMSVVCKNGHTRVIKAQPDPVKP